MDPNQQNEPAENSAPNSSSSDAPDQLQIPGIESSETAEKRIEKKEKVKRAGKKVLEMQEDKTSEVFRSSSEQDEEELERELLKEGIQLSPEEIRELYDAIPELFENTNPEFSAYLKDLQPRLEKAVDETAKLKEAGFDSDSLDVMVKFLETEEKNIGNLKDENVKQALLSYIGVVLNTEQLAEDMKHQTKVEIVSNGADLIPVVGSMKMMYECAAGKTAAGEKLHGTGRVLHGGMATLSLCTDAAAIASAFGTGPVGPAVIESAKAGIIGTESAVKGAKIAATITRFAAICRKTGKLHNVSKTIYKIGVLVKKYPKIAGGMLRFMKIKKNAGRLIKISKRASKTAELQGRADNEDSLPEREAA